uniref:Cytochrome b-c1 complex subunit 8 n=2 Tax=Kryptolebias marmoratus TaxID=37003 RepID=A0A3Q3AAX0_KRYMA
MKFGDLARMRHIITFSLSPFEQKIFPNFFSEILPNTWRRFRGSFFRIAPPTALGYMVYSWGTNNHKESKRKKPEDYANDE